MKKDLYIYKKGQFTHKSKIRIVTHSCDAIYPSRLIHSV